MAAVEAGAPRSASSREWQDISFLQRIWRRREAQLLLTLSVNNLAAIRLLFEQEEAAASASSSPAGLTAPAFVRVLLKLLGQFVINKEELVITILDLFSSIDVNGDQRLEWPELLSYIVESGSVRKNAGALEEVTTYFAVKHAYRAVFSPTGGGTSGDLTLAVALANATGIGERGGANDPMREFSAHAVFERLTHISPVKDALSGEMLLFGFRQLSANVHLFRWVKGIHGPVLLPHRRFRHDSSLKPHQVLSGLYVPETHAVVTVSRESSVGPYWVASWGVCTEAVTSSPDAQLARRVSLPAPCSLLVYNPATQWVVACADDGAAIYIIDVHTVSIIAAHPTGSAAITAAVNVTGHLAASLIAGSADGSISLMDLRSGREVPGHRVLAHEYGVRALTLCSESSQLVSIGFPHPHRLVGNVGADVFSLLVWNVAEWLECVRDSAWHDANSSSSSSKSSASDYGERSQTPSSSRKSRGSTAPSSPPDKGARWASSRARTPAMRGAAEDAARGRRGTDMNLLNLRPRVLSGHKAPPCALALQNELGVEPHIISADEAGTVLVWHLVSGEIMQRLCLYSPPRHVAARTASRVSRVVAGLTRQGGSTGSPETGHAEAGQLRGDGKHVGGRNMHLLAQPTITDFSEGSHGRDAGMVSAAHNTAIDAAPTDDAVAVVASRGAAGARIAALLRERARETDTHGGSSVADILHVAAEGSLERSAKLSRALQAQGSAPRAFDDDSSDGGPERPAPPPPQLRPTTVQQRRANMSAQRRNSWAAVEADGFVLPPHSEYALMRAGRRLSYGRASVSLYPGKGEGAAEACLNRLVSLGQLDATAGTSKAIVHDILMRGEAAARVRGSAGLPVDEFDAMLQRADAAAGYSNSSNSNSSSSSSSSSSSGNTSREDSAAFSRGDSANRDVNEQQHSRRAPSAYSHSGSGDSRRHSVGASSSAAVVDERPSQTDSLSDSSDIGSGGGGSSSTASGQYHHQYPHHHHHGSDHDRGPRSHPLHASSRRNSAPTNLLELRLGSRSSVGDYAMVLAQVAREDQASHVSEVMNAAETVKAQLARDAAQSLSNTHTTATRASLIRGDADNNNGADATTAARMADTVDVVAAVAATAAGAAVGAGLAPMSFGDDDDHADDVLDWRAGFVTALVPLPACLGGQERRVTLVAAGTRTGITHANTPGGLVGRHGMRLFTWMQDVPDSEPLIPGGAVFVSSCLSFVTASTRAVVVWDALTGRPSRVFDTRITDGAEISAISVDARGRKIFVGDTRGCTRVVNLLSGAVMKELDPRASRPRAEAAPIIRAIKRAKTLAPAAHGVAATASTFSMAAATAAPNRMPGAPLRAQESRRDGGQLPTAAAGTAATSSGHVSSPHMAKLLPLTHATATEKGGGFTILRLIWTSRQEVLSLSQDGSVWSCDDSSLEGYGGKNSRVSTILRLFPMPLESVRLQAPSSASSSAVAMERRPSHVAAANRTRATTSLNYGTSTGSSSSNSFTRLRVWRAAASNICSSAAAPVVGTSAAQSQDEKSIDNAALHGQNAAIYGQQRIEEEAELFSALPQVAPVKIAPPSLSGALDIIDCDDDDGEPSGTFLTGLRITAPTPRATTNVQDDDLFTTHLSSSSSSNSSSGNTPSGFTASLHSLDSSSPGAFVDKELQQHNEPPVTSTNSTPETTSQHSTNSPKTPTPTFLPPASPLVQVASVCVSIRLNLVAVSVRLVRDEVLTETEDDEGPGANTPSTDHEDHNISVSRSRQHTDSTDIHNNSSGDSSSSSSGPPQQQHGPHSAATVNSSDSRYDGDGSGPLPSGRAPILRFNSVHAPPSTQPCRLTPRNAATNPNPLGTASLSSAIAVLSDPRTYALLLFDNTRATLVGACARYDPVSDMEVGPSVPAPGIDSAHMHTAADGSSGAVMEGAASSYALERMRHLSSAPAAARAGMAAAAVHRGAATVFTSAGVASSAAAAIAAGARGEAFAADAPGASTASGGVKFSVNLSSLTDQLLTAVTAMEFLDPLPALLTAHEDGWIRVWAVPPAAAPFTCRIQWIVPPNPTLVPSALMRHAAGLQREMKRRGTLTATAKRLTGVAEEDFAGDDDSEDNDEEEQRHFLQSTSSGPSAAATAAWRAHRAARAAFHSALEERLAPLKRRFLSSVCIRPASACAPMRLGTLFPTGHAGYLTVAIPKPPPPAYGERVLPQFTAYFSGAVPRWKGWPEHILALQRMQPAVPAVMTPSSSSLGNNYTGSSMMGNKNNGSIASVPLAHDARSATAAAHEGVKRHSTTHSLYGPRLALCKSPTDCVDENGAIVWGGDSDGEIHRWYISISALISAGLYAVPVQTLSGHGGTHPTDTTDHTPAGATPDAHSHSGSDNSTDDGLVHETSPGVASCHERHLEETPVHTQTIAIALAWSRSQARVWAHSRANAVGATLGAELAKLPGWPAVPEVLPPKYAPAPTSTASAAETAAAAAVAPSDTRTTTIIGTEGTATSGKAGDLRAVGVRRDMVPGPVWEGSWSAHSNGDITSLSCVCDTGVNLLLSGGSDGLARLWDGEGRLVGTLDPLPRYTAPVPDWTTDNYKAKQTSTQQRSNTEDNAPAVSSRRTATTPSAATPGDIDAAPVPRLAGATTAAAALNLHPGGGGFHLPYNIPIAYGPGRGSGYSFDAFSMTHLTTERVYHASSVWVPAETFKTARKLGGTAWVTSFAIDILPAVEATSTGYDILSDDDDNDEEEGTPTITILNAPQRPPVGFGGREAAVRVPRSNVMRNIPVPTSIQVPLPPSPIAAAAAGGRVRRRSSLGGGDVVGAAEANAATAAVTTPSPVPSLSKLRARRNSVSNGSSSPVLATTAAAASPPRGRRSSISSPPVTPTSVANRSSRSFQDVVFVASELTPNDLNRVRRRRYSLLGSRSSSYKRPAPESTSSSDSAASDAVDGTTACSTSSTDIDGQGQQTPSSSKQLQTPMDVPDGLKEVKQLALTSTEADALLGLLPPGWCPYLSSVPNKRDVVNERDGASSKNAKALRRVRRLRVPTMIPIRVTLIDADAPHALASLVDVHGPLIQAHKNGQAADLMSLVLLAMQAKLSPGVHYGAGPPPQKQALWHVQWDLAERREAQRVVAERAIALATLHQLTSLNNWGRRQSLGGHRRGSVTKQLRSLTAASASSPCHGQQSMPPGYARLIAEQQSAEEQCSSSGGYAYAPASSTYGTVAGGLSSSRISQSLQYGASRAQPQQQRHSIDMPPPQQNSSVSTTPTAQQRPVTSTQSRPTTSASGRLNVDSRTAELPPRSPSRSRALTSSTSYSNIHSATATTTVYAEAVEVHPSTSSSSSSTLTSQRGHRLWQRAPKRAVEAEEALSAAISHATPAPALQQLHGASVAFECGAETIAAPASLKSTVAFEGQRQESNADDGPAAASDTAVCTGSTPHGSQLSAYDAAAHERDGVTFSPSSITTARPPTALHPHQQRSLSYMGSTGIPVAEMSAAAHFEVMTGAPLPHQKRFSAAAAAAVAACLRPHTSDSPSSRAYHASGQPVKPPPTPPTNQAIATAMTPSMRATRMLDAVEATLSELLEDELTKKFSSGGGADGNDNHSGRFVQSWESRLARLADQAEGRRNAPVGSIANASNRALSSRGGGGNTAAISASSPSLLLPQQQGDGGTPLPGSNADEDDEGDDDGDLTGHKRGVGRSSAPASGGGASRGSSRAYSTRSTVPYYTRGAQLMQVERAHRKAESEARRAARAAMPKQ